MAKRKELENKKAMYIAELEFVKIEAAGGFDYRVPMLLTNINDINRELAEIDAPPAPEAVEPEVVALDSHEMRMTHEVGHQSADEAGVETQETVVKAKPRNKGGRPKRK